MPNNIIQFPIQSMYTDPAEILLDKLERDMRKEALDLLDQWIDKVY